MKLFKNGVNLHNSLVSFIASSNKLFIYVPYIKLDGLRSLIEEFENVQAIIVRWEARDLITGASDLEIYPFLRNKGITLYRNPRIHLKAFVDNYTSAFIGSANISQRALNHPETSNYNYELATIISDLSLEDRLYFNCIESESMLITDNTYEQFKQQLPEKIKAFPKETDFSIKIEYPDKNFLISSLPLTYSVETLFRIYETKNSINDVELNCAMHDLANYNIPFGLTKEQFSKELKYKFFNHAFIRAFLENLEKTNQVYFGEAKEWIHKNCSNVPLPMKWEITENIQILYRWIVKLSDGIYAIDQPNYSQRLYLK
jgi:phosphatidylserine/phosphatidylglycerophosphate/cardiolipin synthase-like enzyme